VSLINHPGSDHQMAVIGIDAGHARDIMLMLADAHALISDLAGGTAPTAARQAAAVLRDTDSPYSLDSLATALAETVNWLSAANGDALSHTRRLTRTPDTTASRALSFHHPRPRQQPSPGPRSGARSK
jgi:hypothetical protein